MALANGAKAQTTCWKLLPAAPPKSVLLTDVWSPPLRPPWSYVGTTYCTYIRRIVAPLNCVVLYKDN